MKGTLCDLSKTPTGMDENIRSENSFQAHISQAMDLGRNTDLTGGLTSNAPLDQARIEPLIRSAGFPTAEITHRNSFLNYDFVGIHFRVDLEPFQIQKSWVNIMVSRMKNINTASTGMRNFVQMYLCKSREIVKRTPKSYGDCSLQSENAIFWTHHEIFLKIENDKFITYGSKDRNAHQGSGESETLSRIASIETLNDIASNVNHHLMANNIPHEELPYPKPILRTSLPVSIKRGQVLELQLDNIVNNYLDVRKEGHGASRVDVRGIGSVAGLFHCSARRAVTCRITFLVAHREYLTVTSIIVDVEKKEQRLRRSNRRRYPNPRWYKWMEYSSRRI